jgi:hypothetical protein
MIVRQTFLSLVLLAVAALAPSPLLAIEPQRPGQESFLTRAMFADGRLWILSDAGVLSSIAEGDDQWRRELLSEPVVDACTLGGELLIATGQDDDGGQWTLRRQTETDWSELATIAKANGYLRALDCASDKITVFTSRRLIEIDGSDRREVALSGELNRGRLSAVYGTPAHLFVGFNAGEWGGGLQRIDRQTGEIVAVQKIGSKGLCDGPLNTNCDPVNGIAAEPWNPDCVAAAIGLVHFRSHGRIIEVCGDRIERLYYKPYDEEQQADQGSGGEEPFVTVAFFGLTRAGDALWAPGIDGLYRFGAGGAVQNLPMPSFKVIDGIQVSFDFPDFVLVLTDVNQRRSMSGSVPLLVPR